MFYSVKLNIPLLLYVSMYTFTVTWRLFPTCREHTYVNDPLLNGWLARMPVIPEAELHLWTLVILKHSHHYCLKWRKKCDRNGEN